MTINAPDVTAGRLVRNVGLNLAGQAVPVVIGLVTIPFTIRGLGLDGFGILSIAWMLLGYFSLFDLGLGRATTKFVAEELQRGDGGRLRAMVWTSCTVNVSLGFVGGVIIVSLAPFLAGHVFQIPADLVKPSEVTFIILGLAAPFVLVSIAFRGVLEAAQRFDYVNLVRVVSSSLTFILPVVGLLVGLHIVGIVLMLMIARLAAGISYLFLCIKVFPQLKSGFLVDRAILRTLMTFGGWVTVTNVVSPVLSYLDRFLIGSLVSVAALSYYTAPYEMVTRLWILPASLTMTLFPAFSTIGATSPHTLAALHMRSVKYLLLFMGPFVMISIFFATEILTIWLGGDFAHQSTRVFQILVLGVLVNSLAQIPFVLIQGLGRPDITAKFHLGELVMYVPFVWLLVTSDGITGGAFAWTMRVVADFLLVFSASLRFTNKNAYRDQGLIRGIAVLLLTGGLLFVVSLLSPDILVKTAAGTVLVTAFVMGCWWYVFDSGEREFVSSAMWSLLRLRRGVL